VRRNHTPNFCVRRSSTANPQGTSDSQRAIPDALDLLEQFGSVVTIRRSREICRQGQPTEFCWRIVSGCARTVTLMEDGRRLIREFIWPGDMISRDDLGVHEFNAEAVTDLTLRRHPRRMVEVLAQSHAELGIRLRMLAAAKLRDARRQMTLLGRKTAMEKIASFLAEMDHRSTPTDSRLVELPMNRGDIADNLGMFVETISRILAQLHHNGIVAILRAGIELRDRVALRDLARELAD
jgi:CRP/FNR family transcriptional regulator, nitrogen fixation regulation protein